MNNIILSDLKFLKYLYRDSIISEINQLIDRFNFKNKKIYLNFEDDIYQCSKLVGHTLPDWFKGITIGNQILILKYNEKYYDNYKEFKKIIIHEIVHAILYNKLLCEIPNWLNEGIAIYLSKQDEDLQYEKFLEIGNTQIDYSTDYFYERSYALTKCIINQYGENKFFDNLLNNTNKFLCEINRR